MSAVLYHFFHIELKWRFRIFDTQSFTQTFVAIFSQKILSFFSWFSSLLKKQISNKLCSHKKLVPLKFIQLKLTFYYLIRSIKLKVTVNMKPLVKRRSIIRYASLFANSPWKSNKRASTVIYDKWIMWKFSSKITT